MRSVKCLIPGLAGLSGSKPPGRITFNYRFQSEDPTPITLRLKVEVNTREHFTVHGFQKVSFAVNSRWFRGEGDITTYDLDELLGTKFRALYQRRKGRDLFDMATALWQGGVDPQRIIAAFLHYMAQDGHSITRAVFEENLSAKLEDNRFRSDIPPLLAVGRDWNIGDAAAVVGQTLCPLLPGEPWRRVVPNLNQG